jgi:hypothetical protein
MSFGRGRVSSIGASKGMQRTVFERRPGTWSAEAYLLPLDRGMSPALMVAKEMNRGFRGYIGVIGSQTRTGQGRHSQSSILDFWILCQLDGQELLATRRSRS